MDLRKAPETRYLLGYTGAPFTAGFSGESLSGFMTFEVNIPAIMEPRPGLIRKPHITSQLCALVDALPPGRAREAGEPIAPSVISLELNKAIAQKYKEQLNADFTVGIHPATGSSVRQWPVTHFARLADLLISKMGARVLFFGTGQDSDMVDDIMGLMENRRATSLAGELSLTDFMAFCAKLDLFIGNVSGPSHIAGASGVPTLTINAGQVSPYEWHPLGAATLSVRMDLPCSPCYFALPKHCPYGLKCLKMLWPEKVYCAVEELMLFSSLQGPPSGKDLLGKL